MHEKCAIQDTAGSRAGRGKEMLFCSEEFIFVFLPVFMLVYYITPERWRNLILLAGSLWFYFFGERTWFFLIILSILLHFFGTSLMRGKEQRVRKRILLLLMCYDFGSLFVFKYLPFVAGEINKGIQWLNGRGGSLPQLPGIELSLPLGISFYTFQIAAYAIDVYRRPEEYEKDVIAVGTYVCMFPQLIAGPIVLFRDVAEQMKKRKVDFQGLEEGLKLFTVGLGYKMLIANVLGNLWHEIQVVGIESISSTMAWMGAVAFSLQLYFDFNGYSLMAMGLGRMLGFSIPRNFNHPYIAVSVTDFWRRWHITLSTWFREYVYIPLGGNRKGTGRMLGNLFVVWALTGIWHGAGWNFLIWGIYYFLLLLLEKTVTGGFLKKHHGIGRLYTLIMVVTGWVIFNLEDIKSIGIYLGKMFCFIGTEKAWTLNWHVTVDALRRYGLFFLVAIILSTYLPEKLYKKYNKRAWFLAVLLAIFWGSVYQIMTAESNPFLYFRF